ncbi:MAG: ATP-binding cassette domain-containing protein, partial [Elusimicrobiota bacterium]|nr:ATP-binding cassette domain-containing protein [Elusimicrobiota bacterium]
MKIEIKKIEKEFKTLKRNISVLKNVNLEVADGEFFVLLGPSGCGKSTLLNIIAGLENPTGG